MTIIAVFYVGSIVAVFQVSGTDNLKGLLDWRSFPYLPFADFSHLHWQERRRHFLSPFLQLKFSWWPNAPNFDREINSSFFFFVHFACSAAQLLNCRFPKLRQLLGLTRNAAAVCVRERSFILVRGRLPLRFPIFSFFPV